MTVLRGDIARLERCTAITTGGDPSPASLDPSTDDPLLTSLPQTIKRSKPFKYTYEKEIVMYAYFKKLDYHSTECIYSPTAYRGHARALVKDLEAVRPSAIVDIVSGFGLDDRAREGLGLMMWLVWCADLLRRGDGGVAEAGGEAGGWRGRAGGAGQHGKAAGGRGKVDQAGAA